MVRYFTDGREVSNKDPFGGQMVKSKTKWDGDKLVSRIVTRRMMAGRPVDMDIIEEWKLSKDGKTLTKKVVIIFPKNAPDRVNTSDVPAYLRTILISESFCSIVTEISEFSKGLFVLSLLD